jgi:hypothetical protein
MSSGSQPLRLWAFGDAHVGTDKQHGRGSLADAISQSEFGGTDGGPPFQWDLAIDVGDMSGAHHNLPDDAEGEEVVKQLGALQTHRRGLTRSVRTQSSPESTRRPAGTRWRAAGSGTAFGWATCCS